VTGSYQAGLEALGKALQNYSAGRCAGRRVGFPRFRAKGRCRESVIFQRPRLANNRHVMLDRRLGPLRTKESMCKLTRLLASDPRARVMRSTVQCAGGGWAISFTVERSAKRRRARRPRAAVGVDVGLARLATLSNGQVAENSRPLQTELRRLRRLQRQLDRQRRANNAGNYLPDGRVRPGAKTWVKSRRMLRTETSIARLHERVANLRRHRAHLLTTALTREFGVIGVETSSVGNLLANRRLARHIADAGWGLILNQLKYKTSWSDGSILVAFACHACGDALDRDLNAALNLAHMADRHAHAEGIQSYVARIGRFTRNARGGQVSLVHPDEHSPIKRDGSPEPSQRREALAVA
jgi:putative transposase